MRDHYYCGAAKVCDTEQIVLVKSETGYIDAADIVEIHTEGVCHLAIVVFTSFIRKGSADDAALHAHSPVYEIENVYRKQWSKKEEETKND